MKGREICGQGDIKEKDKTARKIHKTAGDKTARKIHNTAARLSVHLDTQAPLKFFLSFRFKRILLKKKKKKTIGKKGWSLYEYLLYMKKGGYIRHVTDELRKG